jgi:hypothetical protein
VRRLFQRTLQLAHVRRSFHHCVACRVCVCVSSARVCCVCGVVRVVCDACCVCFGHKADLARATGGTSRVLGGRRSAARP